LFHPTDLIDLVRGLVRHPVLAVSLLLALAVVVRLAVPDRPRVVVWTRRLAVLGLLFYLVRTGRTVAVPGDSGWDLEIFYRAGREASAGRDPYLHSGRDVFLNPPPALALLRPIALLPYGVVRAGWALASAGLALALVPLANRVLARGRAVEPESPPPLPGDLAALLTVALVNSTGSTLGLLAGQFSALTAFATLIALSARQGGRPLSAGASLAVAAFKPATVIPFLPLFARKADRATWFGLAAVSLALAAVAVPPGAIKERVVNDLRQIRVSGEPGGVNDYEPSTAASADMISFNHGLSRLGFHDRRLVSAAQALGAGALLSLAAVVGVRRPFPVAAAVAACGSMLFLYHRVYDTVILALPMALAASLARTSAGGRRAVAVGCAALLLAAANLPRDLMIDLTRQTLDGGSGVRFVRAAVLPYATWAIALTIPGLLGCTTRLSGTGPRVPGTLDRPG
jgi:hypothetical protein